MTHPHLMRGCRRASITCRGSSSAVRRWTENRESSCPSTCFSFLRDRHYLYPEVWEVPPWFRTATLLAAAELDEPRKDLVVAGQVIPVHRKQTPESPARDSPADPTSPASPPGGGGAEETPMDLEEPKQELETSSLETDDHRSARSSPGVDFGDQ
eukprot:1345896-Amphidinium_carterae.2